ncbi:hypothetical protein STAN_7196 [Streptomyces sp. CBMAI 2042]|uniref:hypothetical protein n=1 Tax=Streptomyces sp. CBMAI 2042 TaxID=2305222 RepID=UPI000F2C1A86|nr:hypothetical protein [Streptomyces sp. CBMAI 2042]RLV64376.1 hypothetical protein STAN_7196 [Streptomyces sp. CBMAI 2042]
MPDARPTAQHVIATIVDTIGSGFHTLHIRHLNTWSVRDQRAELECIAAVDGRAGFGVGQQDALRAVTRLLDDALSSGTGVLTVVSNTLATPEPSVALYRVHDGRCITAEEYHAEQYGAYPQALAAAAKNRATDEQRARRLYEPRGLAPIVFASLPR